MLKSVINLEHYDIHQITGIIKRANCQQQKVHRDIKGDVKNVFTTIAIDLDGESIDTITMVRINKNMGFVAVTNKSY
jgi:hypothetical protein